MGEQTAVITLKKHSQTLSPPTMWRRRRSPRSACRSTRGEFVALMGPSGCGKSTLLNIVGMIDSPTEGEYFFCGEDVARYPESRLVEIRRRHLGFVFQSFNLIDDLNVFENVELPRCSIRMYPVRSARRACAKCWSWSICGRAKSTSLHSSRVASNNASPWRVRSYAIRS